MVTYYLVNHTRNEFCNFDDGAPIFEELERILSKYEWKQKEYICVMSEDIMYAKELDIQYEHLK